MTVARRSVLASVLLALMLSVIGCGGGGSSRPAPSAIVEGTINFSGAGVKTGTVNFIQKDTGFAASAEIYNGNFKIVDKIPPGYYLIFVTAPTITTPPEPGKVPPKIEEPKDIPARYREQKTSTLTAEIVAGKNTVPLEMTP